MKFFIFSLVCGILVKADGNLSCDKLTVSGSTYNLAALNKDWEVPLPEVSTPPTTKSTVFILNPCGKISPTAGGCQDAWLCEKISHKYPDNEKELTTNLITYAKDIIDKIETFDDNGKTGLTLTYSGEKYEGVERKFNLKLICDKEQKDSSTLFHFIKIEGGTVFIEWTGELACSGVADKNLSSPQGSSSTIGTFFLVLFIVFCFYMFGGVIYNIFIMKESRFPDYIPNSEFWMRLYDTLGEGFSKLFGRVSGGRYVSL